MRTNAEIGLEVWMTRQKHGLSQTELADEMKREGFDWTQVTVSRTETGARELRYAEGVALRRIYGFDADSAEAADVQREARALRRVARIVNAVLS